MTTLFAVSKVRKLNIWSVLFCSDLRMKSFRYTQFVENQTMSRKRIVYHTMPVFESVPKEEEVSKSTKQDQMA